MFSLNIAAKDFVGSVGNLYIKDNGMVLFSINNESGSMPLCDVSSNSLWPFYFIVDNEAKSIMYSTLLDAKNKNTKLYIGHEENENSRCLVNYVAIID